jgi:hypothetical protein
MRTFEIGANQRGEMFIACRLCGMSSFHPDDIKQQYCGGCHQFHEIMEAAIALDPNWRPDAD